MIRYYETERLILRTLNATEGQLSLDYYLNNRVFLTPFEPTRDESFYTLDHHNRLTAREQDEMDQHQLLRLWVFLKNEPTGTPIGNIGFSNIVRGVFLSCFLGYKLDINQLQQGYMSEALIKGIEVIFEEFGLHRIEANIMPKNTASLALAKKLGFEEEGLGKKYLRINDVWEDHIHMVKFNQHLE